MSELGVNSVRESKKLEFTKMQLASLVLNVALLFVFAGFILCDILPRRANLIEANLLFQNPSRLSFTADAISSDNPDVLAAPVTCDRDLGSYLIHDGSNPWDCSNEKWNWDTIRMINSTTPATTPRYIRCFMDKWSQVIPETCRLHIEDTPKKTTQRGPITIRGPGDALGQVEDHLKKGLDSFAMAVVTVVALIIWAAVVLVYAVAPFLCYLPSIPLAYLVWLHYGPKIDRTRLREFSRRVASEFGRTFCDEKATPSPVSEKLLVWDGNSKSIVEVSIDKISVDTICKALDNDGDRFRAVTSHEGNVIVQPLNLDDPDPIQDVCLYSRRKLQEILTARVVMDFQRPDDENGRLNE
jgi:hypothetical protein